MKNEALFIKDLLEANGLTLADLTEFKIDGMSVNKVCNNNNLTYSGDEAPFEQLSINITL